jgi:uncharacterized protein
MHTRLMVLLLTIWTVVSAGFAFAEPQRWEGSVELPGGQKLNFEVALEKDTGTISIPAQGAKDLALTSVTLGEKISFTLKLPSVAASAVWEFKVSEDGKSAEGVLKQMGQEFPSKMKALAAGESAKGSNRPQEPKAPFPYKSEEVTIIVGTAGGGLGRDARPKGHTLSGTLTLPEGKGPFPGVILVSGSGPQDRDELLLGHKPFLVLADHLTRKGIAVLRYDDRGVGRSSGNFALGTSDDFAEDAQAAIKFLAARPEINASQVGIVGHSEGGLIAPMVAAVSDIPKFIVLLAGPGMPGLDLLVLQGRLISEAGGLSKEDAARNAESSRKILEMVRDGKSADEVREAFRLAIEENLAQNPGTKDTPAEERAKQAEQMATQQTASISTPWMKRFLQYDPAAALAKVKVPVLALNGEKDLQVPPKENLSGIESSLKAGGNTRFTTKQLPGLNHLFQTCTTGSPSEYAEIEETFAPAALEAVSSWILETAAKPN